MKIYLDNLYRIDCFVIVHTYDREEAIEDGSIMGSNWEAPDDMDVAYAIITDSPTLVDELEAEGYEVDDSDYCAPDEEDMAEYARAYERELGESSDG